MAILKSIFILFLIGALPVHAQEYLLPVMHNVHKSPELLEKHQQLVQTRSEAIGLPFWDDFTNDGPYPDPEKWIDSYVFINTGFAVHPKTYGVATFDILDENGEIYDHATIDNIPFAADHLTSHILDLSEYSPSDSLILTFYYQPQGAGAPPADNDSLVLQFRLPPEQEVAKNTKDDNDDDEGNGNDEHLWQSVWKAEGESLMSFSQVHSPILRG